MSIAAHRAMLTTARGLVAALLLVAFGQAGQSEAQALIKVNDNINFKLGLLLQPQADFQEVANATNTADGGYMQNLLIRRARLLVGGQVAKNVFFYFSTENSNLGKSTQTATGTTGLKSPGTGFNLLDAVGEWRIAKEFGIEFGEILVPVNRIILTSSTSNFMLDQSAYNLPASTVEQNNAGRDTGFMARGYFFFDRLEYRAGVFSGFRAPGVKNSYRFTGRLQMNLFDREVYNLPAYAGANFGNKKILAFGGAYDTQSDYKTVSADMFLDFPIGIGSFESTVMYQYINGGTFQPTLPEQNTFTIEGGLFLKKFKIGPSARYEQKMFTQDINVPKNEGRMAFGLNYYPYAKGENNFNMKFWWQRVTPKVGYAVNQFTFQMQVAYF